ncbi:MAG: baseplate J/gp47 family protein [Waterburya sp.]
MSTLEPVRPTILFNESEEELVRQIQARILLESQGVLDDFSPASPLSAITEGQAYAIAYLGETINKIPQETVMKFLEILGVTRSTARNSLVPIEFTLTQGFGSEVKIPRGFRVFTDAGIVFTLNLDTYLSPETPRVISYATSIGVGLINNVDANTITGYSLPLPGLQSITNPLPARGGEDAESVNETIARSLSFLSFRHLTTTRDYEEATRIVVGDSYRIKAYSFFEIQEFLYNRDPVDLLTNTIDVPEGTDDFPALELDPLDDLSRRNVYLVVSDNGGVGVNVALQNKIKNYLLPRLQVGTNVVFIPPEKVNLYLSIVFANNIEDGNINRLVNSLRISQSVLYSQIGVNLPLSEVLKKVEAFGKTTDFIISLKDPLLNPIVEYNSVNDIILAPRPNIVFVIKAIEVKRQQEGFYTTFSILHKKPDTVLPRM